MKMKIIRMLHSFLFKGLIELGRLLINVKTLISFKKELSEFQTV